MTLPYMRFINLMQAIKQSTPAWPVLDPVEDQILTRLAAEWATDKRITTSDAIALMSEISETTVHRRILSMQKKGVINLATDKIDRRIKNVVPTQLTLDYFTLLGNCFKPSLN